MTCCLFAPRFSPDKYFNWNQFVKKLKKTNCEMDIAGCGEGDEGWELLKGGLDFRWNKVL